MSLPFSQAQFHHQLLHAKRWSKYPDKVIPLWIADMDLGHPLAITDALNDFAQHANFGYSSPSKAVLLAIVAWIQEKHGWQIQPEWVVFTHNLHSGLRTVVRAMSRRQDQVLIPDTIYPPIRATAADFGREVVAVPMLVNGDHGFTVDWHMLEQCSAPAGTLLQWCSPHNPSGTVWAHADLERLAALVVEKDWYICSDEIHADLVLNNTVKHTPIARINAKIAQRCITLMSPNKTFNIAGIGLGYAIICNDTIRKVFSDTLQGYGGINGFSFAAAHAAYTYGEPWRQTTLQQLRNNLQQLRQVLVAYADKVKLIGGDATYLAWLHTPQHDCDWHEVLLRYKLAVYDGRHFGKAGYMRVNFGTRPDILREALKRLDRAFSQQL